MVISEILQMPPFDYQGLTFVLIRNIIMRLALVTKEEMDIASKALSTLIGSYNLHLWTTLLKKSSVP